MTIARDFVLSWWIGYKSICKNRHVLKYKKMFQQGLQRVAMDTDLA